MLAVRGGAQPSDWCPLTAPARMPEQSDGLREDLPRLHEFTRRLLDRDFPGLRRERDSLDLVQTAAARALSYLPRFVPRDGEQFPIRSILPAALLPSSRWKIHLPVSAKVSV